MLQRASPRHRLKSSVITMSKPAAVGRRRCALPPLASLLLATALTAASSSTAFAHITHRSPYQDGVAEEPWATASNVIFVLSQVLGWAYLTAVLKLHRPGALWRYMILALLFQIVIGLLLFLPGMAIHSIGTHELHISYSGLELFVLRPEMISGILVLNAITLVIGWAASALLLLLAKVSHRRWLAALLHTLVFHALLFPIGPLLGLIYVLYLCQVLLGKPSS